jgi:hypothetical protein
MATTTNVHDWQSLVELSGLLISEPVLNENFSDGPQPLPAWLSRKFRKEYERWQAAEDKRADNADRADDARKRWQNFILVDLLEFGNRVGSSLDLPPDLKVELSDYMQTLKPDRFIRDTQGNPQVLVYLAEKGLDRPEQKTGRWKASPFTKMDRLLRETKVQLGILSNGFDWRLVYAAPGLPTSYITWTAAGWKDEVQTLQAYQMLLRDPAKLLEMASESQSRQADVTDKLGNQVLSALSIFVRQLDKADAEVDGALLQDLSPQEVYEMALFVMMRLVFMFYAEENTLLPHGEPIYDDAYGLTRLWNNLNRVHFEDENLLKQREDAFPGLLASFRLIHAGCAHPDLNMVAYGGALFDPERFPVLEDPRLRINNDAIWRMLRKLTTAEADGVRQRVSYRSLQVEQLGYVYENLLGYTVKEAKEPMISAEGVLEAVPVSTFIDALEADGEDGVYEYYKGINDLHWTQSRKAAEEIAERAKTSDEWQWVFDPLIEDTVDAGQRYVAYEMGTRKRGGIFYTPPQLTSFLVEQALKPQVYENPDDEQGIRSAQHILSLTVCDPAMGSGAFLVQSVRYLADRLLEAWDAAQTQHDDEKLVMPYAQIEGQAKENYGIIPTDRAEALAWARRLVAERCIYGVDLNRLAVELAKLSIWLVTLSKDKPFTFLDHRLRHGNSLIGASFFKETTVEWKGRDRNSGEKITLEKQVRQLEFIPDEALKPYKDADKDYKKDARSRIKGNQQAQVAIARGQMGLFGDLSVEEALNRLIQQKADLEQPTQRADEYDSKAQLLRDVLGQGDYPVLKEIADLWSAVWFWDRDIERAGMPPTSGEYQDTVQTILGTAKTNLFGETSLATDARRIAQIRQVAYDVATRETFFHWELEYPQVFTRHNAGFDAMVGNPPWETIEPNSQEFFEVFDPNFREYGKQKAINVMSSLVDENQDIAREWQLYNNSVASQAVYANSAVNYQYQGRGKAYTYKLFLELIHTNLCRGGIVGIMLPSGVYADYGSQELREMLFSFGSIKYLLAFSNERFFFPGVHHSFKFTMLVALIGERGSGFASAFRFNPRVAIAPDELHEFLDDAENLIYMKVDSLKRFSPDSLSIMEFQNQLDYDITDRIYGDNYLLGSEEAIWRPYLSQEYNMTSDSDMFSEVEQEIILYEGKMISQFDPFYSKPRYWVFNQLLNRKKSNSKVTRLSFRAIARSTDERTLIGCFIPQNCVGSNSLLVETESLEKNTSCFLLTIMNSFVLDYVIRQKVQVNVSLFHLYQLPVPRLQAGNPYFDAFAPRAARLTCTTHHFADLWHEVMGEAWDESKGATDEDERQQLRNEIDALVAHLYGLSREDFAHILGTFPLVFKDDAEGHAKKARLLDEYDRWAGQVAGWSRD